MKAVRIAISIKQFFLRLRLARAIILSPSLRWFVVYMDPGSHTRFMEGGGLHAGVVYHKFQLYNVRSIIKHIAARIDPDLLVLEKAEFEAKAELRKEKSTKK